MTKTADTELANANLEILAIENSLLTPPFDANETKYRIDVAEDIKDLNIFAVPENENARVQISGEKDLKEGNNIITILLTAENGFTTKKYIVEAYKRNKEEQKKYEEEQKDQTEKLDEAYQIEKIDGTDSNIKKENSAKNIIVATIAGIALTSGIGIFIYFRNRK